MKSKLDKQNLSSSTKKIICTVSAKSTDTCETREKKKSQRQGSRWPVWLLVVVYWVALLLAAALLPSLDGTSANNSRLAAFICISALFWSRIALALKRKESNKDYIFYSILMIGCVLLISPVHSWLRSSDFPALEWLTKIFYDLGIY